MLPQPPPPRTPPAAFGVFIFGLLSLPIVFLAIPVLALGPGVAARIKDAGSTLKGRGLVLTGIWTARASIFLWLVLLIAATPMCCVPHPDAMITAAQAQILRIETALHTYKDHHRFFPGTLEDLVTPPGNTRMKKLYLRQEDLIDPWSEPFQYRPHHEDPKVYSKGPDKTDRTDDDVWL